MESSNMNTLSIIAIGFIASLHLASGAKECYACSGDNCNNLSDPYNNRTCSYPGSLCFSIYYGIKGLQDYSITYFIREDPAALKMWQTETEEDRHGLCIGFQKKPIDSLGYIYTEL